MIVRLEPVSAFGLSLAGDVTVGDVVLTLAGSDGFGAGRVQEATKKSVNVKKTARRPNSRWCPRMLLWLPNLDDVLSVRALPARPKRPANS